MFWEWVPHTLHGIISVVGHWPKKISIIRVESKFGENGISHNILDIGTNQLTNFRALWTLIKVQYHTQVHKYCFSPFDRIIQLLFLYILREPLNFKRLDWSIMISISYIELNWKESCTMQVYHLKSSCQDETAHQPKWPKIGLGGNWPKNVSSKSVDGTIGESGMSTLLLDIGTNLGDELQGLVNMDRLPFTHSTRLLIPI